MDGSGKNRLMMIIIIALLVVMLGVIGALVLYLRGVLNDDPEPEDIILPPAVIVDPTLHELVTFSAGAFTRNLRNLGSGAGWYIQMNVSVEIDSRRDPENELFDLMTEKLDLARDVINRVTGQFTYDDLREVNGEERLAERLQEALSDTFQTNLIVKVNIPNITYLPVR